MAPFSRAQMYWDLSPYLLGDQALEARILATDEVAHLVVHVRPVDWLPNCSTRDASVGCLEDHPCALRIDCRYMSDGVHHAIPDTLLKLQISVTPHVQYLAIGDGQPVQVLCAHVHCPMPTRVRLA